MDTDTEAYIDKTKKQREQILLFMKNKAQNMYNRPSPAQSNPSRIPTNIPSSSSSSHPHPHSYSRPPPPTTTTTPTGNIYPTSSALDFLKEYESNKTSQPEHETSSFAHDRTDKSFDYNSTLFRNLNSKEESHIAERASSSNFMNNGSNGSFASAFALPGTGNSNGGVESNQLLSKIDELLQNRNKKKNGMIGNRTGGITSVYDDYLEKKSVSVMSGSSVSGLSNTSAIKEYDHYDRQLKMKGNTTGSLLNKLKTIQQQQRDRQRATLTIDHSQHQHSHPQQRSSKKSNPLPPPISSSTSTKGQSKKPPLPPQLQLESVNTIERQKKKIQETMMEIKKEQGNQSVLEKDSLIFQFSDGDSEGDTEHIKNDKQKAIEKEKEKQKQKQKQRKNEELTAQKNKLLLELQQIESRLQSLQKQQQQDQNQQI